MKFLTSFLFTAVILLAACSTDRPIKDQEQLKLEIMAVEKQFNDLAQKEGTAKAFAAFAASDAVIKRGEQLIKGNETIADWYQKNSNPDASLSWKPDFVEVSASGDLAYTYGQYAYTVNDSTGNPTRHTGYFHTVWKRQKDGSWKFVWD